MTRYYPDLYPRTAPFSGTVIDRLEPAPGGLQRAEYRGEANGAGVGIIGLRGDGTYGQLIDPQGLQYVKFVSDDTAKVVGGMFLEKGDFDALTEGRTRYLEFSGAGALSYLDREIMWRYTYHPQGDDPEEGGTDTWQLYNQGPLAGGDKLGAVLWRVLYEAMGYLGAPGYLSRAAHEDDKTATAIPEVSLTFDGFEDSDGNDWSLSSGEFTAQVGESVYAVVQRLMRAGLYVEMDPDTGAISAWEASGHRRDRTGGAYGASVVRFVGGDNIKSDAKRAIAPHIKRTAVLAYGQNMGSLATGAGDVPWHGSVYSDVKDDAALEQLAASEIKHRADAGDTLRLRMILGDTPLTGRYRPWEEVLLDDIVTVHTGTSQWDYNEAEYPVAALEIKLRPAGDWDAFVHLGAVFQSAQTRTFQAPGVPHHGHPLNLCRDSGSSSTGLIYVDGYVDTEYEIPDYPALEQSGIVLTLGTHGSPPYCDTFPGDGSVTYTHATIEAVPGTSYTVRIRAHKANTGPRTNKLTYKWVAWDNVGNSWSTIATVDNLLLTESTYPGVWNELTITAPVGAEGLMLFQDSTYDGWHWNGLEINSGTAVVGDLPQPIGATGEATFGTGTKAAPCDHVHEHGLLSTDGLSYHDIPVADTTAHEAASNPHPVYVTDAEHALIDHGGITGSSDWGQKRTVTVDQDVTNSAAMTDSVLSIPYVSGEIWEYEGLAIFSQNDAAADIDWIVKLPGLAVTQQARGHYHGLSTTGALTDVASGGDATNNTWPTSETQMDGGTALGDHRFLRFWFTYKGDASGNVVFAFGNRVAGVGDTSRLHAGSRLWGRKLA